MDQKRLYTALSHRAKKEMPVREVDETVTLTVRLAELCGAQSQSRHMLHRIGSILLTQERPTIVAPVCPDYSHENGRYTFRGLGGGVPLLARRHHEFLKRVTEKAPFCSVLMLIADHEADDELLCRAVGLTQDRFRARVLESLQSIRDFLAPEGWSAECMTSVLPSLVQEETCLAEEIRANQDFIGRVHSDTVARMPMYERISRSLGREECCERTIKTAAQYAAMGDFAARSNFLVANHSTTNLVWYRERGAALLHNAIDIY